MKERTRTIGIIGTGRVARALALGFARRPEVRLHAWGRSPARAGALVTGMDGSTVHAGLADLVAACDTIAIAVADDAMAMVIAGITAAPLGHRPFVFHASGGSGTAILEPLRRLGARTAAVHPAMTFTGDPAIEVERMAAACFAVTGSDPQATAEGLAIVRMLGGSPVEVAEQHRTLYHAALCHGANHLVTLIAGSLGALARAGLEDPAAVLAPLVRAALDNSLASGLGALSGPVSRGDAGTVRGHLDAIAREVPELLPAYRAMASATLDAMERQAMPTATDLREALDEGS
ncbi:Rossmann-like and DUF2520 domain-containing protein [Novosphingobium resinovorum]|uniref:Rossmann-like and DUF2520 domain-containing protein n=1 Tax=Novosphingobium resinovorum TaxID=158500 RepID=UPI002ED41A66|nr:Rossmann-like and DUF2520 domain-containing protein [Novosphingobium resinovorum]